MKFNLLGLCQRANKHHQENIESSTYLLCNKEKYFYMLNIPGKLYIFRSIISIHGNKIGSNCNLYCYFRQYFPEFNSLQLPRSHIFPNKMCFLPFPERHCNAFNAMKASNWQRKFGQRCFKRTQFTLVLFSVLKFAAPLESKRYRF